MKTRLKLQLIAWATVCALPLCLSPWLTARADQLCQASLDTSNGIDAEVNNCPIATEEFSIAGTFSNSNWQASFWAWEPAYYILNVKNQQDGSTINLTGFDVIGTTSRPQYRFTDADRDLTHVVTFQYADADTIRLEIYQNDRAIVNELLTRESGDRIGGP
jgi:hypothetical protein